MRVLLGFVLLGASSMHGGSTAQHQPADTAAPSSLSSSPAGCFLPAGIGRTGDSRDQQDAAFAWASRGSLRRAVPCFAAALQRAAQHAWLWVDYARALQGAVRTEEQAMRGCDGAENLRLWGAELSEAQAASHVALLLDDQRDLNAAQLVQRRIAKTFLRHGALVSRCVNKSSGLSNASRQSGSNAAWLVASLVGGRPRSLRDAVELGKAYCTGPHAATVSLAAGWATAISVRDALLALRLCGVVRLQRVWHPAALDAVATAHRREFEDYLRRADMDPSTNVTGDDQSRATRHGVQRWRGRWESVLPFAPPFNDPALTMNPSLLAVLQSGLGSARLELDTFTQITSIGGAGSQPFHADVGPLWPQQRGQQVEPHGLVCVVPLMNVSSESRGPTAFQVASHFLPPGPDGSNFWRQRDKSPPAGVLSPTADVGDAIVFDLRLRHRGGSNLSPYPRPLLYMSYVHEWWQDRLNFASAQSSDFDTLSPRMMKLYSRLDHREHVRRLTTLLKETGVSPQESMYQFQQQALSL